MTAFLAAPAFWRSLVGQTRGGHPLGDEYQLVPLIAAVETFGCEWGHGGIGSYNTRMLGSTKHTTHFRWFYGEPGALPLDPLYCSNNSNNCRQQAAVLSNVISSDAVVWIPLPLTGVILIGTPGGDVMWWEGVCGVSDKGVGTAKCLLPGCCACMCATRLPPYRITLHSF